MDFINGIGGVFLRSKEPEALAKWYAENLGLETMLNEDSSARYMEFWSLSPDVPSTVYRTVWAILPATDDELPVNRTVTINYRVNDLDAICNFLKDKHIEIDKREDFDYGRFAWLYDPDGNRIELYQQLVG